MNLTEVVREFLLESHENLDQLDRAFVELEQNPHDHDNIAGIFRTIHTIKGTAGFLAFPNLERVAHAGETLLSKLREGTLELDRDMTSALLRVVDAVRSELGVIEAAGSESDKTYPDLIAELTRLSQGPAAPGAAPVAAAPMAPATPVAATPATTTPAGKAAEAVTPPAQAPAPPPAAAQVPLHIALAEQDLREGPPDRREVPDRRQGITDSSLRVDVGLLDKLMNLVGELVLARNQILQFTATQSDTSFIGATQRLNLVTSELQEGVMKTRMQPIGNVWSKFPRVVRDVATICHKPCGSRCSARKPSWTRRSSKRSRIR